MSLDYPARGIGSVIPTPDPASVGLGGETVWTRWTSGAADTRAYSTARAALCALLLHRSIRRIWLPAYGCGALFEGVTAAGVEPVWYAVDERLNADIPAIRAGLQVGDAVLAIAWFGRPPEDGLRTLARDQPETLFIEDRAQALDPAGGMEGAVHLYSPRKLLGVADGGILVGSNLPPAPTQRTLDGLWAANDARAADPDGQGPEDWFPAYQHREAGFDTRPRACSERTLEVLRRTDCSRESEARRRNWKALAGPLEDMALWSIREPAFAPLAFPIVVADAAALVGHLAGRRIWAARHWAHLPCPQSFAAAHALSERCVSLPLDGRYGLPDMDRIVVAVREFSAGRIPQTGVR